MADVVLSPPLDAGADSSATETTETVETQDTGSDAADDGASQSIPDNESDDAAGDDADPAAKANETGDGRTLSDAVKKHIAEVAKTNPKLAEYIKRNEFKTRAYEQAFKTPQEATAAKELIEEVGGVEGVTQLRADVQEFTEEIGLTAEGNPALLEKIQQQQPEGFAKLVPHGVALLERTAPEEFARLADGILDKAFTKDNVYTHVQSLLETIEAGGDGAQQATYKLVQQLSAYLKGKQGKSQAGGTLNKDEESFQKKKDDWEKQKDTEAQNNFDRAVFTTVNTSINKEIKSSLATLLPKGHKLPVETENAIIKEVFSRSDTELNSKTDFKGRYDSVMKTREQNRAEKFLISRAQPGIFALTKAVLTTYRGVVPTKKAAPTTATTKTTPVAQKGTQTRKPTFDEAQQYGFSKDDYLGGVMAKKLVKNGKVLFQW